MYVSKIDEGSLGEHIVHDCMGTPLTVLEMPSVRRFGLFLSPPPNIMLIADLALSLLERARGRGVKSCRWSRPAREG